jgi:hypothetical protein
MKKILFKGIVSFTLRSMLLAFCFLLYAQSSLLFAGLPGKINYQGKLKENGEPVNGTKTIEFKIYNVAAGGNSIWNSEQQDVLINNGLFNYQLGSNKSLSDIEWNEATYYLEIIIEETTILKPREELTGVAYSLYSEKAEHSEKPKSHITYMKGMPDNRLTPTSWTTYPDRILNFTKKYDNSVLRIVYYDCLGHYQGGSSAFAASDWRVRIDGDGVLYISGGTGVIGVNWSMNFASHMILVPDISAGEHTIDVQVKNNHATECTAGWHTHGTNMLMVEELFQ